MSDFGIKISEKGSNVNSADVTKLLLNSKYPFSKIDTQHPNSFTTLRLTFYNDPPEVIGTTTITKVYPYLHGYPYTPQYWAMGRVVSPPAGFGGYYDNTFSDMQDGVVRGETPADLAYIFLRANSTSIDVYIAKYYNTVPLPLTGMVIDISFYVFVDGI